MKRILMVVVLLLITMGTISGCGSDKALENQSSNGFTPSYKIIQETDISTGYAVRKLIQIELPKGLDRKAIEDNFTYVVRENEKKYAQKDKGLAIDIRAFTPEDSVKPNFAECIYAHEGEWTNTTTKYRDSKMKTKITIKDEYFKKPEVVVVPSKNDVNDEQRARYKEWNKLFMSKISKYHELDVRALQMIEDFKAKRITKSSKAKVESLWEEMNAIREPLLKLDVPEGFTPTVDKEISRMVNKYIGGVNDRQAGLWIIVDYCNGAYTYNEAISGVNDCLKTSGQFFADYEKKKSEIKIVFE